LLIDSHQRRKKTGTFSKKRGTPCGCAIKKIQVKEARPLLGKNKGKKEKRRGRNQSFDLKALAI